MRRLSRTLGLLLLAVASGAMAQGDVTEQRVRAEASAGVNWFLKGGDFNGRHFTPLDEINRDSVDSLGLAWSTDLPVPDGFATTAIEVDGVIYLGGAYSVAFAIDAATGRILWQHDAGVRERLAEKPSISWIARANRGVAVWHGKVYQTTADCWLIALDAATGAELWKQHTCDPVQDYSISDSPYVGGNKVFVGNAGSESHKPNRGYVTAYDADTGKLLWRFFIVPSANPEENDTPALKMAAATWPQKTLEKFGGGGQAWNEMTYDPESGLLYFGTSGAYPYIWQQRSPEGGNNLFLSSVVAVNAETGEYVWHYQTVPEDSFDYNATMNIALADLEIDGKLCQTLLIAPKNGFHYTLDRRSGELLAAGKFATVNWATEIDMETGRPVMDPATRYWDSKLGETTLVWPNMWGAHSWQAMAYSPIEKLSYIPVIDIPAAVRNEGSGEFPDDNVVPAEVDGKPFSPGKLVAMDPVTGTVRWRVDQPLAYNGGVLATAGGLVFQGNAEGDFVAYAADSGERLWSAHLGSAVGSAPSSYSLGGRQYIVVPVGGGGGQQFYYPQMHASARAHGPVRLMTFALDGQATLAPVNDTSRPLPEQPSLEASATTIAEGRQLYSQNCKGCHGFEAVARVGGTVPDLRYATAETLQMWPGIVIGGARIANGMPKFELSPEQADAIRAYVLSRANELRAAGP